jgi:hypothetical protein
MSMFCRIWEVNAKQWVSQNNGEQWEWGTMGVQQFSGIH